MDLFSNYNVVSIGPKSQSILLPPPLFIQKYYTWDQEWRRPQKSSLHERWHAQWHGAGQAKLCRIICVNLASCFWRYLQSHSLDLKHFEFLTAWAVQRTLNSKIDKVHLALIDFVWICMTMYVSVWICSNLYNSLQLCMTVRFGSKTLYDSVWLCMTFYNSVWFCMTPVWLCMSLHDSAWLCVTLYDSILLYFTLYDFLWLCITREHYIVTNARTERLARSAIPFMQRLLNANYKPK